MTLTDNHIVESYSQLLEGLSASHKIELIESLAKSLKSNSETKGDRFYRSFGAWESDKTAAKIITELKESKEI